MHRYGQFCPIAVACEIFAERWTPLILRDLMIGKRHFNALHRGLPLISRSLLAQRLRELEAAGLVERRPKTGGRGHEYRLSAAGTALQPIILQLGDWGRQWVYPQVSKQDLDAGMLMWDIHQRLRTDALPVTRTVVQIELRGPRRGLQGMRRWWLVLERPSVELCLTDPGHEVDLVVIADLFALTRVWMGELAFRDALRAGDIRLQGAPALARAFPGWLKLSVYAYGAADSRVGEMPRPGDQARAKP